MAPGTCLVKAVRPSRDLRRPGLLGDKLLDARCLAHLTRADDDLDERGGFIKTACQVADEGALVGCCRRHALFGFC